MKKLFGVLFTTCLFLLVFLVSAKSPLVQAQVDLGQSSGPIQGLGSGFQPSFSQDGSTSDSASQLAKLISTAIGAITLFAGLAFLFYFIMGAMGWLTAGGDKQKLDNSRDRITTAVMGLVLVIAAYAVTGLIGSIFGLDILNVGAMFAQLSL